MKNNISDQDVEKLHAWMPKGSTVYTILRHVSASGMTRIITLVVFIDGEPIYPNYLASELMGWKLKDRGVVATGCGMDMGFALVYDLSYRLYGDGYSLKQRWL